MAVRRVRLTWPGGGDLSKSAIAEGVTGESYAGYAAVAGFR
jgi:hypothetical protein